MVKREPKKTESHKFPFLAKKEWGQNFLLDKNFLQKIVNNCPIDEKTIIIEIGSGYGHLTDFIAKTNCHKIISCEKDPQLFLWLNNKWKIERRSKVLFLHQDALKINWREFCQDLLANNPSFSFLVIGNLPYAIANTLICNLLENAELFKYFVFLVQKEVAQRWMATSQRCKKEYSSLSAYINLITKPEIIFNVPKQSFVPRPNVDGSLIRLEMRKTIPMEKEKLANFFNFLKNCFRYRRKTLWNNLLIASCQEEKLKKIFPQLNYDKKIRPQGLTTQDYLDLYKLINL